MSLICPKCKKQISKSTVMCPHCGFSVNSAYTEQKTTQCASKINNKVIIPIIWAVLGIALFVVLYAAGVF